MRKPLLVLPFDHRSSFSKNIMNYTLPLTEEEIESIRKLKEIVYEAFLEVRNRFSDKEDDFGILIDEEYGRDIIESAKKHRVRVAVSVEKSGQNIFDFEYEDFGEHIKSIDPTYVKALVRYNPDNIEENKIQLERLGKLSNFCTSNEYPLLFELLVPPTQKNIEEAGTAEEYDKNLRTEKTCKAIEEIKQAASVAIWKLEGMERNSWEKVLSYTGEETDVIVLGRGEDEKKVEQWLTDAAAFDQIIGFAVGRTVFAEPLTDFVKKIKSREEVKDAIARNFEHFVQVWYSNKQK